MGSLGSGVVVNRTVPAGTYVLVAAFAYGSDAVKSHLASVQRKIDARNRTEIAGWAWESGLMH